MKASDFQTVERWTRDQDGVFTIADLKVLFGGQTEAALYKKLERFLVEGMLVKVKRGMYARPDASLEVIASRICPESYISLGTVLARAVSIGSVPARRVQAVKVGRPRVFACALGTIEFLSIVPRLFFGFVDQGGTRYATPEKAYLDACYFTHRGKRLSFDVDGDVNTKTLNTTLLEEYLEHYDSRFVAFFRRLSAE